ncbi:MAG: PqqD family protein [Clostridiales bacterium]|jgi:hypothetical protein|nr:PqqD family protein [Clostridiales bacterium]
MRLLSKLFHKRRNVKSSSAPKPASALEVFAPNAPALVDKLIISPILSFDEKNMPVFSGAHVMRDGTRVITVNEIGRELLRMADGKTTIDEMIEAFELERIASEVGMFFVTLGQAGYLKNRIEIELYENRTYVEGRV